MQERPPSTDQLLFFDEEEGKYTAKEEVKTDTKVCSIC